MFFISFLQVPQIVANFLSIFQPFNFVFTILRSNMTSEYKLIAVRKAMRDCGLAAVIVPSQDPHQSEYVAAHWKAREWISGFSGSAGIAVVTLDHAGLWTDSRYFLQAEQELAVSGLTFHKQTVPGAPEHLDWLKATLKHGDKIGIDGALLSIDAEAALRQTFEGTGIALMTTCDPIGMAWTDRPSLPTAPVFAHAEALAGKTRMEKLAAIRAEMATVGADSHLSIALDDIAWTFNLRGRDVECNPVFYAYALIASTSATLFVDAAKLPSDIVLALAQDGVSVRNYADLGLALAGLQGKLLLDPSLTSAALAQEIGTACTLLHGASPAIQLKAIKNAVELAHIRQTMARDGVALLRLYRWLEATMASGETVDEYTVGERLAALRASQAGYFGESFPAIAGYASNGAIVHYRPAAEGSATLKPEGIFLLDSGGQYLDGTTDITRTIALGEVPAAAIIAYTMVLKGHIALAKAQFPQGTAGHQLDPLARMHLWSQGLNYGHGTGHGVGFFLNVHEGPHSIGSAVNLRSREPIVPGMIVSNEPGYYENGQWGIRIENLVVCITGACTSSGQFYAFETLSLFPIDATLIDRDLIDKAEWSWLQTYHQTVYDRLSPLLDAAEQAWLLEKCAPYLG